MSGGATSIQNWLEASKKSAEELANVALGFDDFEILGEDKSLPVNQEAAFVALIGDTTSVQVGIASNMEGCQALSRALLGMEPDEPDLESSEVADALSEIANILAGQVKIVMAEFDGNLKIGIPIFLSGKIEQSDKIEKLVADVKLGGIPVKLIVMMGIAAVS